MALEMNRLSDLTSAGYSLVQLKAVQMARSMARFMVEFGAKSSSVAKITIKAITVAKLEQ